MPHLCSRYTKNPQRNRINKTTHTHTPARSRTNARTWIIGFVKNVSYYRCGPLTTAYIDKN